MIRRASIGWLLVCCTLSMVAQTTSTLRSSAKETVQQAQPQISQLLISPDTVSELHLKPNFATTIVMPEPVTDVVLGAPALFSEEHSEHASTLVVVKPITHHAATSNLLISTLSGQHVSLKLISDGSTASAPVDFVRVYKHSGDFLIPSDDPADAIMPDAAAGGAKPISVLETAFADQQRVASPSWTIPRDPKKHAKIAAAIGSVSADGDSMVVAFSILNESGQWVEVLPPQIQLNSPATQGEKKKAKKKQKSILADLVPITDYHYTQRKLAPGERADGVVRFERPDFKLTQDRLQMELATTDAIDSPLLLNLPFTAPSETMPHASGLKQENSDERQ